MTITVMEETAEKCWGNAKLLRLSPTDAEMMFDPTCVRHAQFLIGHFGILSISYDDKSEDPVAVIDEMYWPQESEPDTEDVLCCNFESYITPKSMWS